MFLTPFLNWLACARGLHPGYVKAILLEDFAPPGVPRPPSVAGVRSPVTEHPPVFEHVGDGFGFLGWRAVQELEALHVVKVGVVGRHP